MHEFRMAGPAPKECHCTCGWRTDSLLESAEEMWADFVLHHATQDGWVPGFGDLNWCRRTFALIKEGGIWSCSAGVFRVWKSEQRVELVAVGHDSNLLERTRSIIWLMGWSYSEAPLDKSTECGMVQA